MIDTTKKEIWTGPTSAPSLRNCIAHPGRFPSRRGTIGLDRGLVGRWASSTTPIPAAAGARIRRMMGVACAPDTGWRRHQWLVVEGSVQVGGWLARLRHPHLAAAVRLPASCR